MNEIKKTIEEFCEIERITATLSVKPDLEAFNDSLKKMNSFCIPELYNKFHLMPKNYLESDDFYEEWKAFEVANPRHLFKLSHYKHEKYGDLYLAYVSKKNPRKRTLEYSDCFFITKIENNFKIVKKYFIHEEETNYTYVWSPHLGYEDLTFETAGKFISCERYLEPSRCEFSMKDYLKDK